MWPFTRKSSVDLESWPIIRSRPVGTTAGYGIAVFINNWDCHLTKLQVYADGLIDCWGGVDMDLFAGKLRDRWVVPAPKPGQALSVFNFGRAEIRKATWIQSPERIRQQVASTVRRLNPEKRGLLDLKGSDSDVEGKVRVSKMGLADGKPYRLAQGAGTEILGDSVHVLRVSRDAYDLVPLFVFADGNCRLGAGGELFPVDDLPALFESGGAATRAPGGSLIRLPGLGEFQPVDVFGRIEAGDRIAEIRDMHNMLNGDPGLVRTCAALYKEHQSAPSPATRVALQKAYEAVPSHLRHYCGNMDDKDALIRQAIYDPG